MKKQEKILVAAIAAMAVAIPALVAVSVAQPKAYYVPSGSMEPTLHLAATIRVRQNFYQNIAQVQRGDIVVYAFRDKATGSITESIKRVVGLPSDKVRLSGTQIWINGRQLSHALKSRAGKVAVFQETNGKASYSVQYGDNKVLARAFSATVPPGHLLCLGDNRDNANDSRYTGAVPFKSVIGKKMP